MKPISLLRPLSRVAGISLALAALPLQAADEVTQPLSDALAGKLGLVVDSVEKTPIEGLYQVIAEGRVLYVSADGSYLINGHLYDVDNDFTDLTAGRQNSMRAGRLAQMDDAQMVVFPAEEQKHVVTVFTDIDCGYCQKLHSEMDGYNELGITVRYLGYPRAGLQSDSFNKLRNVWCADDRQSAMTRIKQRKSIPDAVCDTPLAEQYDMGRQPPFGISGTPTIVLEDGSVIGGYVPPERLLMALEAAK